MDNLESLIYLIPNLHASEQGGTQSTGRTHTQTQGENANSTQKGLGWKRIWTQAISYWASANNNVSFGSVYHCIFSGHAVGNIMAELLPFETACWQLIKLDSGMRSIMYTCPTGGHGPFPRASWVLKGGGQERNVPTKANPFTPVTGLYYSKHLQALCTVSYSSLALDSVWLEALRLKEPHLSTMHLRIHVDKLIDPPRPELPPTNSCNGNL